MNKPLIQVLTVILAVATFPLSVIWLPLVWRWVFPAATPVAPMPQPVPVAPPRPVYPEPPAYSVPVQPQPAASTQQDDSAISLDDLLDGKLGK